MQLYMVFISLSIVLVSAICKDFQKQNKQKTKQRQNRRHFKFSVVDDQIERERAEPACKQKQNNNNKQTNKQTKKENMQIRIQKQNLIRIVSCVQLLFFILNEVSCFVSFLCTFLVLNWPKTVSDIMYSITTICTFSILYLVCTAIT